MCLTTDSRLTGSSSSTKYQNGCACAILAAQHPGLNVRLLSRDDTVHGVTLSQLVIRSPRSPSGRGTGTATPHSEQLTKRRWCLVSVQLSGRGRASAVRGGDDSDDLWAERSPH